MCHWNRALTHACPRRTAAVNESGTNLLVIPNQLIPPSESPSKPRETLTPLFTVISVGLDVSVVCVQFALFLKPGYYFPHISAAVLTFTPTAGKGAKSRDPASRCFLVHLVLRRKSPLLLKLLEVVCTSVVYPSFLERQPINPILCNPWTSNLYPPGSLSEMQNRRPHPKPSESESAFWQESRERHLPLNNHWFIGVSSWTSWLKFEGRRKESAEVAKELKTLLQKGKSRSPGLSGTERRSWELNS